MNNKIIKKLKKRIKTKKEKSGLQINSIIKRWN
jgi:hypothetical protein